VRSSTSLLIGGRYRLECRVAAGGVGEVWRARDLVLDRAVAIKLLRPEYAQHPETRARFRAEARHAGRLSHPGIAQVFDYGEADPPDTPYLVLEFVAGPSLAGVLAGGPLDQARTLNLIAQAAAALDVAHRAGVVHRDIKPGNLLIGPGWQVKITDFGIAHAAGSAPVTRTGTVIGTPAYLAPERAAGLPATPASDLYSLGVVGYECLAGQPPFRGPEVEVALAHRERPFPPLPPSVRAEVAELIVGLTAKDPARRPATAAEVARRALDLHDGLAAGTAPAWPPLAAAGPPGAPSPPGATLAGSFPVTSAGASPVTLAETSPVTLAASAPVTAAAGGLPPARPLATQPQAGLPAGLIAAGLAWVRGRLPAARPSSPSGRQARGRVMLLTVAGAVVLAGLTGFLLGGLAGTGPVRHTPSVVRSAGHSPAAARSPARQPPAPRPAGPRPAGRGKGHGPGHPPGPGHGQGTGQGNENQQGGGDGGDGGDG
jgi:hypothetical protein